MPSGSEPPWRVLIVPLVSDGEVLAGRCLSSLTHLQAGGQTLDVLVLDDASPAPGWSARCRGLAQEHGFAYYRTPRQLGAARSMNLAMQRAVEAGYDALVLLRADTIAPSNLVPALVRPLQEAGSVSAALPWSDDAGMLSIPTTDPDTLSDHPEFVDWVSAQCSEAFGAETLPVPFGAGACLALPTAALTDVGLLDPVFAGGPGAQTDWSLRSQGIGYHPVLVPSCFVHDAGGVRGDTTAAALTDRVTQAVIDERFPLYAEQMAAFSRSRLAQGLSERARHRLVTEAARRHGYRIETSRLRQGSNDGDLVHVRVHPDPPTSSLVASYRGFELSLPVGAAGLLPAVEAVMGQPPREIRILDRGPVSNDLEAAVVAAGTIPVSRSPYEEGVL